MNLFYKALPYAILLIAAGFLIGMAGGGTVWGYIGLGLIIGVGVITIGALFIITCIYWRRDKASKGKALSDASVALVFNAAMALALFGYLAWKNITIYGDNMFLVMWMAINIGALRFLWVPKDNDSEPKKDVINEKKEEAV